MDLRANEAAPERAGSSTAVQDSPVEALLAGLRARIGTRAAPYRRTIEAGALIKFAAATGQSDPRFVDESDRLEAAPTYLSTFCAPALEGLITLDLPLSVYLHTDDVADLGDPIRPGDTISTTGELVDVFAKQGKRGPMLFQVAEMVLTNQHGRHVATVRVSTASFA